MPTVLFDEPFSILLHWFLDIFLFKISLSLFFFLFFSMNYWLENACLASCFWALSYIQCSLSLSLSLSLTHTHTNTQTFFVLRLMMRICFNSQSSDVVSFHSKRVTTSTEIDKWMDNCRTHFQRPNLVKGYTLSLSALSLTWSSSLHQNIVSSFIFLFDAKKKKKKQKKNSGWKCC